MNLSTKDILKEQLNEAIAIWQNSNSTLPVNPTEALNKTIDNNKKFADMLSTAISNYINSVEVVINSSTIFGTDGGPIVTPWSPASVMTIPSMNHGYLKDTDQVMSIKIEDGMLGGIQQYTKIKSQPLIIRI